MTININLIINIKIMSLHLTLNIWKEKFWPHIVLIIANKRDKITVCTISIVQYFLGRFYCFCFLNFWHNLNQLTPRHSSEPTQEGFLFMDEYLDPTLNSLYPEDNVASICSPYISGSLTKWGEFHPKTKTLKQCGVVTKHQGL